MHYALFLMISFSLRVIYKCFWLLMGFSRPRERSTICNCVFLLMSFFLYVLINLVGFYTSIWLLAGFSRPCQRSTICMMFIVFPFLLFLFFLFPFHVKKRCSQ